MLPNSTSKSSKNNLKKSNNGGGTTMAIASIAALDNIDMNVIAIFKVAFTRALVIL
jgi:hypothetical protein